MQVKSLCSALLLVRCDRIIEHLCLLPCLWQRWPHKPHLDVWGLRRASDSHAPGLQSGCVRIAQKRWLLTCLWHCHMVNASCMQVRHTSMGNTCGPRGLLQTLLTRKESCCACLLSCPDWANSHCKLTSRCLARRLRFARPRSSALFSTDAAARAAPASESPCWLPDASKMLCNTRLISVPEPQCNTRE